MKQRSLMVNAGPEKSVLRYNLDEYRLRRNRTVKEMGF